MTVQPDLLGDPSTVPAADDEAASDEPTVPSDIPASGVVGLDKKLAAEAYKKVLDGRELSSRERAALKRFEKEKEERLRWQYYAAIPQKHWRAMSGRQSKVLIEQALRYGIPFGSAVVNLPAVVRAFHDFLADNAHKLNKDDDELLQGSGSPALERYREERAAIARLDRLEREGQLLPRESRNPCHWFWATGWAGASPVPCANTGSCTLLRGHIQWFSANSIGIPLPSSVVPNPPHSNG